MIAFTEDIGSYVDREREANLLILESEEHFRRLRSNSSSISSPLLIVQFLDERHVRIYGENSLPGTVLDQLGLDNAWDGPSNRWGFQLLILANYLITIRI